jgi:hypothetical protein
MAGWESTATWVEELVEVSVLVVEVKRMPASM